MVLALSRRAEKVNMINHARTLLLNIFAQSAHAQDAGYEYISPTFRPVKLPSTIMTIRRILFGPQPDQRFLNLRARELLTYVHETELMHYVYDLDPRITYWPEYQKNMFDYRPALRIDQVSGPARRIATSGDFVATNGRARQQFSLALTGAPGEHVLEITSSTAPDSRVVVPFSDIKNAPTIAVPETQIKIRLDSLVDGTAGDTGATSFWNIAVDANPAPAITTLLPTLELLGEPAFLDLFGVAAPEPYNTFKNVWFDHPLPAYRLAGFILAVIYRTEEARSKNNG